MNPPGLEAEIVLAEMWKCPMTKSQRNACALYALLSDTRRHLRDIDIGAFGAGSYHILHVVVLLEIFLSVLFRVVTDVVQLPLNHTLERLPNRHTRHGPEPIMVSVLDNLVYLLPFLRNLVCNVAPEFWTRNRITDSDTKAIV